MKYIEELNIGDTFQYQDNIYVLTCDMRKNGARMGVSLKNGNIYWLDSQTIVDPIQLFILDNDNNVVSVK